MVENPKSATALQVRKEELMVARMCVDWAAICLIIGLLFLVFQGFEMGAKMSLVGVAFFVVSSLRGFDNAGKLEPVSRSSRKFLFVGGAIAFLNLAFASHIVMGLSFVSVFFILKAAYWIWILTQEDKPVSPPKEPSRTYVRETEYGFDVFEDDEDGTIIYERAVTSSHGEFVFETHEPYEGSSDSKTEPYAREFESRLEIILARFDEFMTRQAEEDDFRGGEISELQLRSIHFCDMIEGPIEIQFDFFENEAGRSWHCFFEEGEFGSLQY